MRPQRQLRDMDHAVYAADVNKRAVRGQGLDSALVLVANLDGAPDLLSSSLASLLLDLADRTNYALALTVDLGDIEGLLGLNPAGSSADPSVHRSGWPG